MNIVGLQVPADLSPRNLAQKAELTTWNTLPLCAIAEAHKKEAEGLLPKYLQLCPDNLKKDNPEYVSVGYEETTVSSLTKNEEKILITVHMLEQGIGGSAVVDIAPMIYHFTNPHRDHSIPLDSESHFPIFDSGLHPKWTFLFLSLITATIVPFFVRRVSTTR
jgi:hypothetical protein